MKCPRCGGNLIKNSKMFAISRIKKVATIALAMFLLTLVGCGNDATTGHTGGKENRITTEEEMSTLESAGDPIDYPYQKIDEGVNISDEGTDNPFSELDYGMSHSAGYGKLGTPRFTYEAEIWGDNGYCNIDVYDKEFMGVEGILLVYYNEDEDVFAYAQWYGVSFDKWMEDNKIDESWNGARMEFSAEIEADTLEKLTAQDTIIMAIMSDFTGTSPERNDWWYQEENSDDEYWLEWWDKDRLNNGEPYVKAVELYKCLEEDYYEYTLCFYYRNSDEEDYMENYPLVD